MSGITEDTETIHGLTLTPTNDLIETETGVKIGAWQHIEATVSNPRGFYVFTYGMTGYHYAGSTPGHVAAFAAGFRAAEVDRRKNEGRLS